eukprot:jgi/Botrbrau1/8454/Bobra.0237s0071.1
MAGVSSMGEWANEEDDFQWMLGYVNPAGKPAHLLRHMFPSKVGGRPAWLDPVHLPPLHLLRCPSGGFLQFLLQIYAAVDDHPAKFHRSLFLFISPQGDDLGTAGRIRAFRCQLGRENPFYPPAPSKKGSFPTRPQGQAVEEEAAQDPWRVLDAEDALRDSKPAPKCAGVTLFPEMELEVDEEPEEDEEDVPPGISAAVLEEGEEEQEQDLMRKVEQRMEPGTSLPG